MARQGRASVPPHRNKLVWIGGVNFRTRRLHVLFTLHGDLAPNQKKQNSQGIVSESSRRAMVGEELHD